MATDISDKSWSDLRDADRSILQELAGERDGIDGRLGDEALAVGLLAHDGRTDEIPEEHREEHGEVIDQAAASGYVEETEGEAGEATEASADDTTQVVDEDDEPEDDFVPASELDDPDRGSFIIRAGRLQEWLDHINTLVEEAKITLSAGSGFQTGAVDPANVGMVETTLNRDAFESYDLRADTLIGVSIERLIDVVKPANKDDLVEVTFDGEHRNLIVGWDGHEFTVSLIDPDSIRKEPDLPDLDLPVELEFEEASDFDTAIQFSNSIADSVALAAEDDAFHVVAEGDTDSYEGTFEDREEITFRARPSDERVVSIFSLDYFKDIRKGWDGDAPLTVHLGAEFPTHIETEVRDGGSLVGEVTYMLAPRIQSE